jgi:hypothetical protein
MLIFKVILRDTYTQRSMPTVRYIYCSLGDKDIKQRDKQTQHHNNIIGHTHNTPTDTSLRAYSKIYMNNSNTTKTNHLTRRKIHK